MNEDDHCEICELENLLETLDLPKKRLNDLKWLNRNIHFKNSNHPNFKQVRKLLTNLLKKLKNDLADLGL